MISASGCMLLTFCLLVPNSCLAFSFPTLHLKKKMGLTFRSYGSSQLIESSPIKSMTGSSCSMTDSGSSIDFGDYKVTDNLAAEHIETLEIVESILPASGAAVSATEASLFPLNELSASSPLSENKTGIFTSVASQDSSDVEISALVASQHVSNDESKLVSIEAMVTAGEEGGEELSIVPPLLANETVVSRPVDLSEPSTIFPASEVLNEAVIPVPLQAPPVKKILKFAVAAVGVWLCSPILSMIDTGAVGLLSGTAQQAALNPAVAVTDYAALCIAFMYAATTNMVAAARELEKEVAGKPATSKAMLGAMQLATFVGSGLGVVLFVFARQLLKAIIGNDAVDPSVFAAAMKYVKIRALGMPAAAIIGSTQAACLGMQDILSPLYILLAAAGVNFIGDIVFVGSGNPLLGGAAGAAWATVFSQYVAVALFMKWLCSKPKVEKPPVMNLTSAILELTGKPSSKGAGLRRFHDSVLALLKPTGKNNGTGSVASQEQRKTLFASSNKRERKAKQKQESVTVRGLLSGRAKIQDLLKPPPKEISKNFMPYVLPVTTTQVGKVSVYVTMSHVASSTLGTASMAAQQILISIFYCLCPIADSLSLTAQSFVPPIFEKKKTMERARALGKMSTNFMYAGGIFGAFTVGIVSLIPVLSKLFTSDPAVMTLVNISVPYLAAFFSMHCFIIASEGLLLGQKDLGFLGKMYSFFSLVVPYFMLEVKRAGLSGARTVTLNSLWKVFVLYQLVRSFVWVGRMSMLRKRCYREVSFVEEGSFQGEAQH